jgi:hypothetical protein
VPDASAAANVLSSVIGDADAEVGEFVQASSIIATADIA